MWRRERELVCQVWEIFLLHVTNLAKLIWIVHIQNELIRKYTVWPFSLSLAKRRLGCPVRYREQRRERPLLLLLLERKKEQLAYQGDASSSRYCALSLNVCLGSQMNNPKVCSWIVAHFYRQLWFGAALYTPPRVPLTETRGRSGSYQSLSNDPV